MKKEDIKAILENIEQEYDIEIPDEFEFKFDPYGTFGECIKIMHNEENNFGIFNYYTRFIPAYEDEREIRWTFLSETGLSAGDYICCPWGLKEAWENIIVPFFKGEEVDEKYYKIW